MSMAARSINLSILNKSFSATQHNGTHSYLYNVWKRAFQPSLKNASSQGVICSYDW